MESEKIHIHTEKSKNRLYLFLLLIPSLIFVGVLVFYYSTINRKEAALIEKENTNVPSEVEFKNTITIGDTEVLVEVADTEIERKKGLSGRQILEAKTGMLFVFENQDIQPAFWMKNMNVPIDIIWINDSEVVQIHKNVTPPEPGTPDSQLKLYISDSPIDYVLEMPAGFADTYNVTVGSKVDLSKAL